MQIEVTISNHAKERFIERGGIDEFIKNQALQAFKNGVRFTEDEFFKKFNDLVQKQLNNLIGNKHPYFTREYRKYGKFLYIFGEKMEAKNFIRFRLITVIPI